MDDHPIFDDSMQEIVDSFIVETEEIFEQLDNDLLRLESNPDDDELIDEVFRAVHTVKGTSGFLSLTQFSELAHHFENVLDGMREDEITLAPGMMDIILTAFDHLQLLFQQVVDGELEEIEIDAVIADLESIQDGTFEADDSASLPSEPQGETAEPASSPKQAATGLSGRASDTIRVDVNRLDTLMDLVGELVLGRNRLLQLVEDAKVATNGQTEELLYELDDTSDHVDFLTTELQNAVMNTRMVQVGRVFNKFPRVVRDLAKEFGKEINLEIEGEETELDKSLVEEIGDPLVHLIRNAADHGIEQPDEREQNGKPRMGTVQLSAAHEGNNIVIRIEDDGAGIDPEIIKAKAIEKGVVSETDAAELSETEVFDLIFRPGFSTATQVSQVSGRGVGMDVVKTNLTKLNGSISIDSTLGEGTSFTLKLPLTLAIIRSMLAQVGQETFAVPLHAVLEVVSLDDDQVDTIGGREVMHHRDRVLPLLRLGEALEVDGYQSSQNAHALILGIAHKRLGLVVDDLLSQKEIVIKSLGDYLNDVPGVAGSTILGDGRVIMILDVGELINLEQKRLQEGDTLFQVTT